MQKITPKELGWDGWPTDDQLLKLSEKADGLFHYAATALHWIEGRIRKSGTASRNSVFEKFTDLGIGQLENLYKLILTSFEDIDETAEDPQLRMNQLHGFHHVIGTILVLENPLTIHQITALLADIPEDDFDVTNFLQQFRSVLIPGMTASFEEATPQMHKSFRDYIMNDHAPAAFRVLTGHAHFVTARSCLEVIVVAGSQSGIHRTYSVQHWHRHLRRAMEQDVTLEDERMWKLLGQMVEKAAHTWVGDLMDLFVNVVAVAWKLLQQDTKKDRITRLSTILMKSKVRGRLTSNGISTLIGSHFVGLSSALFITTNFFCLKPYKTIWDHGLLQAWVRHQSHPLEDSSSGANSFSVGIQDL
ncbi:hypothetical protein B0H16DRAFT_1347486 [Mycena metata]|uniref:Uncharacterized protein n=1 Tax=Mycena metata TaxID=1033252 RepID=A0AAD7E101_9AGAR|nr:hypothetical protein B0H16DRAFT_1347486 [Mycena metata]